MKLSQCLNFINQALNYPSLYYDDISLYFDTAISELNTTLHTKIPHISEMILDYKRRMSNDDFKVTITDTDPQVDATIASSDAGLPKCYYDAVSKLFYVLDVISQTYSSMEKLYGVYFRDGHIENYQAIVYGQQASWQLTDSENIQECDLEEYFPDDWILLWLIPYVCFKYTVRDGGTASTFAEELTQGFQQLQDTYDIPEYTVLASVADRQAYKQLVEEHLDNLNILVRTRAIYEFMKHERALNAVYGSMYDRGGF